jgi:hypothetical protein
MHGPPSQVGTAASARARGSQGASTSSAMLSTEGRDIVCVEVTKDRHRVYLRRGEGAAASGFSVVDDTVSHHHRMRDVLGDFLLPQGYPDSVAPQYAQYMAWRGVQYFFGGGHGQGLPCVGVCVCWGGGWAEGKSCVLG